MPSIRLPESIAKLTKTSSTSAQLPSSRINIGGQQFITPILSVLTSTVGLGGLDSTVQTWKLYYVYAVQSNGSVYLVASTNATAPSGYSMSRLVGYFDTDGTPQILTASNQLTGAIGDYKHAHMTEAQFQSANGPGWIVADGRNVAGSAWATLSGLATVPDARGRTLRGKNNPGTAAGDVGTINGNADGDLTLGAYQADMQSSHSHSASSANTDLSHTHAYYTSITSNSTGAAPNQSLVTGGSVDRSYTTGTPSASLNHSHAITVNATGGNETRMKNVTTNVFIRVN